MAPPKNDAFANLFQSAATSSSTSSLNNNDHLTLAERQKKLQERQPNGGATFSEWSNLDILSPSPKSVSSIGMNSNSNSVDSFSRSVTPHATNKLKSDDPFSIFETKSNISIVNSSQQQNNSDFQTQLKQNTSQNIGGSLLNDDEFTDAFISEPVKSTSSQTSSPDEQPPKASSIDSESVNVKNSSPKIQDDPKDEILAGLMDIGFSVEVSNHAMSHVGPDLQACVNFIMSGGKTKPSKQPETKSKLRQPNRNQNSNSPFPLDSQDLGGTINDLSSDLFNKASFFFNQSKKTVMKNIEQFQQSQMGQQGRGANGGDDNLPAWMKSQHVYKKDAIERRQKDNSYEDYGSDDENINQEEINRFMEAQKLKDKERQKIRYEHFKEIAKNKINGEKSTPNLGRSSPLKRNESPPIHTLRPSINSSRNNSNQLLPRKESDFNQTKPKQPAPSQHVETKVLQQEGDLLGLGSVPTLTRAEKFKGSSGDDEVYISSNRRKKPASSSHSASIKRVATSEPLNQFQQSDYDIAKAKASELYANGDYDNSHNNYMKCLSALPVKHEFRIVINSNLALTSFKLGSYKEAKNFCDDGISLVGGEEGLKDTTWTINNKPIKTWYIKLLSRKAESLEMSEAFPEALNCYLDLVSKHGVTDKKILDAKRRVNNIVNPPSKKQPAKKPSNKPAKSFPNNADSEALDRLKKQSKEEKMQEELKFKLHDEIQSKLFAWSNGKEDNLRSLLMSLPNIIPPKLGFPFTTSKKLTINDLMLPKKVKINYMKVISSIHPDKLGTFELEDKMICQGVFIILNKSWDVFKEHNGMN